MNLGFETWSSAWAVFAVGMVFFLPILSCRSCLNNQVKHSDRVWSARLFTGRRIVGLSSCKAAGDKMLRTKGCNWWKEAWIISGRIKVLVSVAIDSSGLLPSCKAFGRGACWPPAALCNGCRPQVIPLCGIQGVIVSAWCISNYQAEFPYCIFTAGMEK